MKTKKLIYASVHCYIGVVH